MKSDVENSLGDVRFPVTHICISEHMQRVRITMRSEENVLRLTDSIVGISDPKAQAKERLDPLHSRA